MAGQYLKRFEVEKLKGKLKKFIHKYVTTKDKVTDRITRKRTKEEIEVDAGYMVYTSRGSSIHFWNKKDLVAAGFGEQAETIDTETGEVVETRHVSLKELAQANDLRKSINRPMGSGNDLTEGLSLG